METAENKEVVYTFGEFILDPGERTLFERGVPHHLPAKEFETLLFLVRHSGRALSKEEMLAAIWDDAFVEEGNLAKQISRLRKLLESNGTRCIETIPKHGYRFNAEVSVSDPNADVITIVHRKTVQRVSLDLDEFEAPARALPRAKERWLSVRNVLILAMIAGGMLMIGWYLLSPAQNVSNPFSKLAVLPIRALSEDENAKILAAGLSDALITKLGGTKELVVRPGSSVVQYGDELQDPVDIGRKLDVGSVLEGTLLESDGRLRVNLRLIDAATGQQIWADKFDGVAGHVFDLEDRISESVARRLLPTLIGQRVTRKYTDNAAAYDDFIKGRYFLAKRTEDGFNQAIEFFKSAAAKDPNFSMAYAGLADCYILLGVWGSLRPNEAFPKAADAAREALYLDPNSAEALVSQAFVEWVNEWDFDQADSDFRRAIDLNPNYATGHHWYSYYLVSQRRNEEAFREIAKARELEGPTTLSVNTDIGEIYSWAARYDDADKYLREVLKIEPNFAIAHHVLGINLIMQGKIDEAIAEQEMAMRLEKEPRVVAALGHAYASQRDKEKAHEMLAELDTIAREKYVSQFSRAIVLTGLGENAAALDALENAYSERSDTMAIIAVHPLLDKLRNEPRFIELLRKVGYQS